MKIKKQTGFTLIEAIVYLSLVSGILITATSFAWNIINSRSKAFAIQEVEQNGRYIVQKISGLIRESNTINFPAIGDAADNISLDLDDGGLQTIDVSLNGSNLEWQENSNPAVLMNSSQVNVTNIEFTNLSTVNGSSRNIKMILTVEYDNASGSQAREYSENFETTIELRDR